MLALFALLPGAPAAAQPKAATHFADIDVRSAVKAMGLGVNIGNTLENTKAWETGWGNPPITQDYIKHLAALGFTTIRLPVAWDTYAHDGRIDRSKLERVGQVIGWARDAGMYCVVNIHWDRGWIDSDDKARFASTFHTFSPEAERKFQSYWSTIAAYFADRDDHLIFEGLNEESNFERVGPPRQAMATLARVNQLFVDTVRQSGGNNGRRLLIIAGYTTDIDKTVDGDLPIPNDSAPNRLLLSIHYYTPWSFAGMTEDASWGRMRPTWGTDADFVELNRNFDKLQAFSRKKHVPVFLGEFAPSYNKDPVSRVRWMLGVARAAQQRDMVPVLWETGHDISRKPPYSPSPALTEVLHQLQH